jgi:hypothetical protein
LSASTARLNSNRFGHGFNNITKTLYAFRQWLFHLACVDVNKDWRVLQVAFA